MKQYSTEQQIRQMTEAHIENLLHQHFSVAEIAAFVDLRTITVEQVQRIADRDRVNQTRLRVWKQQHATARRIAAQPSRPISYRPRGTRRAA